MPAGTRWLNFPMGAWADCPAYVGAQQPAIIATSPKGNEVVMDSFGTNSGFTFSGRCNTMGTTSEFLGTATAEAAAESGPWTLSSKGSFTGEIRITIIGRYN